MMNIRELARDSYSASSLHHKACDRLRGGFADSQGCSGVHRGAKDRRVRTAFIA